MTQTSKLTYGVVKNRVESGVDAELYGSEITLHRRNFKENPRVKWRGRSFSKKEWNAFIRKCAEDE